MGLIFDHYKEMRERGLCVERLSKIQQKLVDARKCVEQPSLENYFTSTTSFSGIEDAAEFVKRAILKRNNGTVHIKKISGEGTDSKIFWEAMVVYCQRMVAFTTQREELCETISKLEHEEYVLKQSLNIK